jgi:sugar lactone lactonase YvrE
VDGSGNIYIADTNNSIIRKVDVATGIITTVAGTPESFSYSGDGGQATSAELNTPNVVQVDGSGNIYIADLYNNRIRKVDGAGIITTVAGTGIQDYTGDGGQATSADLEAPYAVHVDASGNIFITEWAYHAIRKVNAAGIITTVAGTPGSFGYSGDGGSATSSELDNPGGVYWFSEEAPPPPTSSSLEKVTEMYWRFD